MKKTFTTIFLIFSFCFAKAQTPNFQWAKQIGGTSPIKCNAIAIDQSGNVLTTGNFASTVDFDPGPSTFTLFAPCNFDIFINKLDPFGNFMWAKQIGGCVVDEGVSIAVDALGNVYTTGSFQGIADFDPGPGSYPLTASGTNSDAFIVKLDPLGNFVWAKQFGNTNYDNGNSIIIDASGNVLTTGTFEGVVDFDPGPGTYTLASPTNTTEIFVSKLNPAGNFLWAKQIGGLLVEEALSIKVDAFKNIYTGGYFSGIVDFDPGIGTYTISSVGSTNDAFVCKMDSLGNFIWAKQFGGPSNEILFSLSLDGFNNVHSAGYFQSTADFDPSIGTYTLSAPGVSEAFISKLDMNGNFVWAIQTIGVATSFNRATSIAVDVTGSIYTTGYFDTPTDFDPGVGIFTLTPVAGYDNYICKFNSSSNLTWVKQIGGSNNEYAQGIALDISNNIFTCGKFSGTCDFDPSLATYTMTSSGVFDYFVQKMSQGTLGTNQGVLESRTSIYPNPTNNKLNIVSENNISGIKLINLTGQTVLEKTNLNDSNLSIDISNQAVGIYFLQIHDGEKISRVKVVKE